VLDEHLGGERGIRLLERLRAEPSTATVPVVLVTAADALDLRVAGLGAGATDFLLKPFEPAELVARVSAHLRGHAAWLAVVEQELRVRAGLVAQLARIDWAAPPHDVAARVCEELDHLEHIEGAALLHVGGKGHPTLLGEHGSAAWRAATRRLATVPVEYYTARANGPWIEEPGRGMLVAPMPIAIAPLRVGGRVRALLALGGDGRGGHRRLGQSHQLLAEAIDFAAVVTSLVGGALNQVFDVDQRRGLIAAALQPGGSRPVYQPLVSLHDGTTVGYEALTRFTDGTAPEARFLEAAELGMGNEIELATLRAASASSAALPAGAFVSLNVSAGLIVECAADLSVILDSTDRPVVLELTEHEAIDDYAELRATFDAIAPRARLSIDDAGAGFASLRHVVMLQPDYVKLDRSWATNIDADPTRQALVAGLSHFAREVDCVLVAEGIEHAAERDTLAGLGVSLGQGYLLGRPEPVA
jgi:EAL domain-containing protein (putative c-di-GMP-specific phosphodiesterase class I)/CheY-like chemotaxis protein